MFGWFGHMERMCKGRIMKVYEWSVIERGVRGLPRQTTISQTF